MKDAMLKSLRDLQAYSELILFTYLPRSFVDNILTKIPDLNNIFSFIFCQEDMLAVDEYLIKDLSMLLKSRKTDEIIIVDTDPSRIDEEIFSSVILHPYDGTINYSQIGLLKHTLKQINESQSNNERSR